VPELEYEGYQTIPAGEVRLWMFRTPDGNRLYLHASGRATTYRWSGSCWCESEGGDAVRVAQANAMLKTLPPAAVSPRALTVHLPIAAREALGAEEWQALG
jgi:hypothetical protein